VLEASGASRGLSEVSEMFRDLTSHDDHGLGSLFYPLARIHAILKDADKVCPFNYASYVQASIVELMMRTIYATNLRQEQVW
jgi:hypothetical protein